MSNKAILNNKQKRIQLCVSNNWTSGYTTGTGIPNGMCIYCASRVVYEFPYCGGRSWFPRNEKYGKLMTIEAADKIQIEKGIVHPYTRNTVNFVMSRAARKRGYKSDSYYYNEKSKKSHVSAK